MFTQCLTFLCPVDVLQSATRGRCERYLAEVVSAGRGDGFIEQIQTDGAGQLLLREQLWGRSLCHHRPAAAGGQKTRDVTVTTPVLAPVLTVGLSFR